MIIDEFSFKKKSNFKDKRKSFGKGKSEKPLRIKTEKKDYSFKSKKKFFKKK